ncbi:MAG: metallophosphoesterase [Lactimicrobium sp.]|uniref:metallophosphoesterase n=1 Tax=Lactimicrobium sp. TaxID=2563780 RepID=UPI002F356FAB
MKQYILKTLLACLSFSLAGCGVHAVEKSPEASLMTATDLHYLSPSLMENLDLAKEAAAEGDGKTIIYGSQLTDAMIETVIKNHPDAFIMTGDLTLNGEKVSHEELAAKLDKINDAGIQVLVIPGNHDLNNKHAIAYTNDGVQSVDSIDKDEFVQIYHNDGYDDALSRDSDSLSYVYRLDSGVRCLMIDVNGSSILGAVSDTTLSWVEQQLKKAKKAGEPVLAFSHQNFLVHLDLFTDGFRIANGDKLLALFQEYGVKAGFSGHMHCQHIASKDGFTEAVTGAVSILDSHIANITIKDGTLSYQTQSVDVDAWAAQHGSTDEHLLLYSRYARNFFKQSIYSQSTGDQKLDDYIADLNAAFFTGTLNTFTDQPDMDQKISSMNDAMMAVYLQSVLKDKDKDMNAFSVSLKNE